MDEPAPISSRAETTRAALENGPLRRHEPDLAVRPATSLVADEARIAAIARSVHLDDEGGDVDGGADAGR
jgi:hypothetical protein